MGTNTTYHHALTLVWQQSSFLFKEVENMVKLETGGGWWENKWCSHRGSNFFVMAFIKCEKKWCCMYIATQKTFPWFGKDFLGLHYFLFKRYNVNLVNEYIVRINSYRRLPLKDCQNHVKPCGTAYNHFLKIEKKVYIHGKYKTTLD